MDAEIRLTNILALRARDFGANPPATVRVMGYTNSGDGGEATWRRIFAAPPHNAHEVSADGLVWEPVPGYMRDARIWGFGIGASSLSGALGKAVAFVASLGGGIVEVPAGTYQMADISFPQRHHVAVLGAGIGATTLAKGNPGGGAFINFDDTFGLTIGDLTLDCRRSVLGSGGHGIRLNRCPDATVRNVKVLDWVNSGIIAVDAASEVTSYSNITVEDCFLDGYGNANNGVLFANVVDGAIVRTTVKDLGRSGAPCFALQLKTNNLRCRISGCTAINARAGFAIGDDGANSSYCRLEESIAIGCTQAVRFAYCTYCTASGVTADMADADDLSGQGQAPLAFSARFANNNTVTGLIVRNYLYAGSYPITIRNSAGVSLEIDTWNNTVGHDRFILYDDAASASKVALKSYAGTIPEAWSDWISYVTTSTTNTTQILQSGYSARATISGGTLTLLDRGVNRILLDTEASAASDDLDTIANGLAGQSIFITPANDARAVVAKATGGNLTMRGATDRTMSSRAAGLRVTRGITNQWIEA